MRNSTALCASSLTETGGYLFEKHIFCNIARAIADSSNMTRKHQKSPLLREFPILSSAGATGKSRRRIRREKIEQDNDDGEYAEASGSPSPYDESREDEYSENYSKEEEEDEISTNMGSESESVSNAPDYVPETEEKGSSNSASNFAIPSQPITQNASSYIKIAPLPIFRGIPSESPVFHLSRFNKVCRANNASSIEMMMRIFPITLEDEAALWYDLNIEPYSSLSWDEIKLSFLEAYHKIEPVEELRSELMTINQGVEESVRSYFLRLQWILKRWPENGLPDDLLKGVFIDGLRTEFHEWILIQKPVSLNDALRLAFDFEQLRSIRGPKQMVSTSVLCEGMKEGTDDGGIGEEAMATSTKKNQCQCSKHQCWKKPLVRNNSVVSGRSYAE